MRTKDGELEPPPTDQTDGMMGDGLPPESPLEKGNRNGSNGSERSFVESEKERTQEEMRQMLQLLQAQSARVDVQTKLLQDLHQPMRETIQDASDMMKLGQELFGSIQEITDKLVAASEALIRLHIEMQQQQPQESQSQRE